MTNIKIWNEGTDHIVEIKGHTGYAEQGKDIVCAGVSTLAYTLINQLTNLEKEGVKVSFQMQEGYAKVTFSGNEKIIKPVEDTIFTGFETLFENFPQNLSLTRAQIKIKI